MTQTQAELIVRNPDAYDRDKQREAALIILSNLNASDEDVINAATLV